MALDKFFLRLPTDVLPEILSSTYGIAEKIRKVPFTLSADVWPEALITACKVENQDFRSIDLDELVSRLPAELWPEALAATGKIRDEESRSIALGKVAPYIPVELWPDVLSIIKEIENAGSQSITLLMIKPYLPAELSTQLRSECFSGIREIENKDYNL